MGKKTEESRVSYNQMAFDYDTSIEGRYTAFHIEELVNTVLLKENDRVLDVACGTGGFVVTAMTHAMKQLRSEFTKDIGKDKKTGMIMKRKLSKIKFLIWQKITILDLILIQI